MRFPSSDTQQTNKLLNIRTLGIGLIGSAILTASSLYIALKMGALPWTIIFAALISFLVLKLFGSHNIHEANVCHAAMSAGSMVSAGIAFTIPGFWMLNHRALNIWHVFIAAGIGVILGLIGCALLEKSFCHQKKESLQFPIGASAAQTLTAAFHSKTHTGRALFSGMGFAAVFAYLRDVLHIIPERIFGLKGKTDLSGGIDCSPMMLSMGFLIGAKPALIWFAGSLIGIVGIQHIACALNFFTYDVAQGIRTSLGLGLMLGAGIGIIGAGIIKNKKQLQHKNQNDSHAAHRSLFAHRASAYIACILIACTYVAFTALLHIPFWASIVVYALISLSIWLAAWLTGACGTDPLEIFGIFAVIVLEILLHTTSQETLFLAAATASVACGLAGDVMNDFKAGAILKTPAKAQFISMCLGSLVGLVVSCAMLAVLFNVYGADAFGPTKSFVSAQAHIVATMVDGVPNQICFYIGCAIGCILALLGLPVMTLGLGIYLPFYLSSAVGIGGVIRLIVDRYTAKLDSLQAEQTQTGGISFASGILGGESLVGVASALWLLVTNFIH